MCHLLVNLCIRTNCFPSPYSAYDYPAGNAPPGADYNGDYGNYGPPGPGGFPDEYSDGIANCGTGEGQFPCPEKGLCSLPIDLGGQGKLNFIIENIRTIFLNEDDYVIDNMQFRLFLRA